MKERRKARYGPFVGYRSSSKKENCLTGEATAASFNYRYNSQESKFIERDGSVKIGDGFTDISQRTRARQIIEMPSIKRDDNLPQFVDNYPSYMILHASEFPASSTGPVYDRGFGQVVFRTTNDGDAFVTPASSLDSSGAVPPYPTTNRLNKKSYIKVIPLWYSNDDPHRCTQDANPADAASKTRRTEMAAGSRNMLISGNWAYFPNLYATPMRWNLQYNRSSETGYPNRKERHVPIGMLPVLFPCRIAKDDGTATDLLSLKTTSGAWKEFDRFFISMCNIREDGQWGPPFIPQLRTDAADADYYINHFGLVTLPNLTGAGTVDYYPYLPLRGIPKSPADCPYKAILRSPKVDGSTEAMPKTNDLRIVDVIPGDQTSYDMYAGDDSALKIDDDLVRYDQIWPPRARYIGEFDGRVGIGFTWRHPGAMILAPTGDSAGATKPNSITVGDDEDLTAIAYAVEVQSNDLILKRISGAFPQVATIQVINLTGKTLQQVIDEINATKPANPGGAYPAGEWRAAIVPGADGQALVDGALAGSAVNSYGDDALFANPPPGISTNTGNQQCISQAYPGIVYWARTTMRTRHPNPDRSAFWHTTNTPLSSAAGISSAPNYFLRRNRRTPPIESGEYMGMQSLTDGTVLFYSQKVWLFRNTFAGRSGKDEDYRFDLLSEDGSIAWGGQFAFPGGAGWLSKKGIMATNGLPGQVVLISKALYDPDTGLGDLAAEIAECVKAMSFGLDDSATTNPAARFFAKVYGSELVIRYRSAARIAAASGFATTDVRRYSCDIRQRYDFSGSVPGDGMGAILAPGGQPHGWGTPELKEGTVMGGYAGASGLVRLEAVEVENPNADAKDGRIDQFDTGYQDNAVAIPTKLVTLMDNMGEDRRRHRTRKVTVRYRSPTGHSMKMEFARDRARASVGAQYSLTNTGSAEVGSQTKRMRLAHQSPAQVSEVTFLGTRVTAGPAEIIGVEKLVDVLDTPV